MTTTEHKQEVDAELQMLRESSGYTEATERGGVASPARLRALTAYAKSLEELVGDLAERVEESGMSALRGLEAEDLAEELYDWDGDDRGAGPACAICGRAGITRVQGGSAISPTWVCANLAQNCQGRVIVVCHPDDAEALGGVSRPDGMALEPVVLPARTPTGQRRAIAAARKAKPDAIWHLTWAGGAWRRLRVEPADWRCPDCESNQTGEYCGFCGYAP